MKPESRVKNKEERESMIDEKNNYVLSELL